MTYRIPFLILCVVATLPAHAERYSSSGEAFFVGALQILFLMLVFWVWRLIKEGRPKTKEKQHQNRENTISKVVQPLFSPWEKYKMDNADIAKDVESLIEGDLQYLSEKDIFEKIATFKRMSKHFHCPISELKNVTVNIFISKFNTEELRDVVDQLAVKSEIESQEYCISGENTMSHYIQIWLSDYLYNSLNV
ncbi:hypothetical protein [uncultured Duncaniella sp.]|uniref:hypothetical protein n=1 Tax=uncultured Duncaniella sp. TaxID=2768039 RepID=UPI0025DF6559|nr:hypothetical protein [uncultured Duncaniella sp.]